MVSGIVYLVGAGPGDPGLLTVKGRAVLEAADVVVFDRLANPALLGLAPPQAERIDAGKAPGRQALTQEEINAVLVDRGMAGKRVCRLKAGDPFVFGRGGEEALACQVAGVAWEVVPGVTSAIAAPAYAGIPVTHRNVATSFAVITGHENPDKPETQVDWASIAGAADTLVFLMGIGTLTEIMNQLMAHGRAPDTPAASVRYGTWPQQQTVTGTLATLPQAVADAGLKPPAVTVVGSVVGLREQLAWVERRPLFGRRVVVTRSRTQSSDLAQRLTALGADVIEFPVIQIVPVETSETDQTWSGYDWVVFTSTNAVERAFELIDTRGLDARVFGGSRLGAVGQATAGELRRHGLRADYVPGSFTADDFIAQFPDGAGRRVLFPCGRKASATVPDGLRARGLHVDVLPLYDTVLDHGDVARVRSLFDAGEIDAVTFTSSSTVGNFRELLPDLKLDQVGLVAIGPKTAETMRQLGLEPSAEASTSTMDGLVDALVALCQSR